MYVALTAMADAMRDKEKTLLYASKAQTMCEELFGEFHPNNRFWMLSIDTQDLRDKLMALDNKPYQSSLEMENRRICDKSTAIIYLG